MVLNINVLLAFDTRNHDFQLVVVVMVQNINWNCDTSRETETRWEQGQVIVEPII